MPDSQFISVVQDILAIFGETVLPVFLVAASGFALARAIVVDHRSIGRAVFYLFTPALVFRSLYQIDIDLGSIGRMAAVATGVMLTMGFLGWLLSGDQERHQRAGLTLTASLGNTGNMGLPINGFALGSAGLALATIYYVTNAFLGYTIGVFVASSGRATVREALNRSVKVPIIYSAILGLGLNWLGMEPPLSILRSIDLLANAAIPAMLIVLGIQLSSAPVLARQVVLSRAVALRLLGTPLVALLLCLALDITGLERNVLVLQSAMPTAVMATVLTTEYDAGPRLVSSIVFLTTALSLLTISCVLWWIL